MSWLEPVSDRDGPAQQAGSDHRAFLRKYVYVERDENQELVLHRDPSGVWLQAWPSREALAAHYHQPDPSAVDAAEMTGAGLRDWARQHCPQAGVVLRRGLDEQVMVRPAQPVQRVVLE